MLDFDVIMIKVLLNLARIFSPLHESVLVYLTMKWLIITSVFLCHFDKRPSVTLSVGYSVSRNIFPMQNVQAR